MKLGIQTISWGIQIDNLSEALDLIAAAGYQGIEFAQRPDALGVENIQQLHRMLKERNLEFISIVGGTLNERIQFCLNGPRECRPHYLFIEHWEIQNIKAAVQSGLTVGFHPRVFTPIARLEDIECLVEEKPGLRIILDTAHTYVAGDDPITALRKLDKKLIAVHLKDWKPDFGRSIYRFARGFTNLGEGDVDLESFVKELLFMNFQEWVITEIDCPIADIVATISKNIEWLALQKLLHRNTFIHLSKTSQSQKTQHVLNPSGNPEAQFRQELMDAAAKDPNGFYDAVVRAFGHICRCKLIHVSTFTGSEYVSLRAASPQIEKGNDSVSRNLRNTLTGIAIDRQSRVTRFDLTEQNPGAKYGYPERQYGNPEVMQKLKLTSMITVPVYNSGNPNAVRMLVSLFPYEENDIPNDDYLSYYSQLVTQASDMMLDGVCLSATTKVNLLARHCDRALQFLQQLVKLIQEVINCEGVAIFLVNETRDKLELPNELTTGTYWYVDDSEHFYTPDMGLTGRAWRKNETIIKHPRDVPNHRGRSTENIRLMNRSSDEYGDEPIDNVNMWVPLLDSTNKVIGVIRCLNKRLAKDAFVSNVFSYDDASILDAIVQAAAPHIRILRENELRSKALSKLMHELRNPLVAIRGAVDLMRREKRLRQMWEYEYVEDIWSWSELMQRLMMNADWFRYSSQGLPLRLVPTLLMRDVIAPAVRQVSPLLNEKGFQLSHIEYGNFKEIPALLVDRNQFQQVIFNLLSNSIKHSFSDPEAFQVEISGKRSLEGYLICFRDWGPGIQETQKDLVFEEGFRARESVVMNITGQGLGLWITRQIVEAHGGKILVTKTQKPLEFTILLPLSISADRYHRS